MLRRENRLRKRYQYNYIYKHADFYSGKCMVLYALPSKTNHIKVGFAVGKKIGGAVQRNLTRRRLREIVFKYIPVLKQNYNIIVLAKENILQTKFADQETDFKNLIGKAELIDHEKIL